MSKSLSKWDPFRDLSEFQKRLAGIFGAEGSPLASFEEADWQPAVDVSEDDEGYLITADLPEVTKEDAHVTVKDGVLTISGERKRESEEEDKKRKYHRVERSYGRYQRSFRVPEGVDPAKIQADFKDGVLKVRLPKGQEPEPEEHRVEVN
jgi:HSP20 family protein